MFPKKLEGALKQNKSIDMQFTEMKQYIRAEHETIK